MSKVGTRLTGKDSNEPLPDSAEAASNPTQLVSSLAGWTGRVPFVLGPDPGRHFLLNWVTEPLVQETDGSCCKPAKRRLSSDLALSKHHSAVDTGALWQAEHVPHPEECAGVWEGLGLCKAAF